jgi:hypothetical protein
LQDRLPLLRFYTRLQRSLIDVIAM